jgi:hypothetical protein
VEVDERTEACGGGALADLDRPLDVDVATAVSAALGVEGIVPHAHAHIGDAVLGEHREQVGGRAVGIAEHDTGFLERQHARHVDAVDEVGR